MSCTCIIIQPCLFPNLDFEPFFNWMLSCRHKERRTIWIKYISLISCYLNVLLIVTIFLFWQNPPSFTLSEPKPVLLRSTSDEGPLRKLAPTEDLKRQSLMEPLAVSLTIEPLLQTTPQVCKQQCTMSSLVCNSAVNENTMF